MPRGNKPGFPIGRQISAALSNRNSKNFAPPRFYSTLNLSTLPFLVSFRFVSIGNQIIRDFIILGTV